MTLDETMAELKALGSEKMRQLVSRKGAGENQFGVKTGDLRALANRIKTDPELAAELWETGNLDAQMLATLLMKPKQFTAEDIDRIVRTVSYSQLADWLMTNVVRLHAQKEKLRQKWMTDNDPMAARAGWSLTTERVIKSSDGLDLGALLSRIELEMGEAPAATQWTMNYCLAEIGINFPEHREHAIAIGEKLGVLRDYPVSKGCTSPFAPIWISEIVRRQS